MSVVVLATRSAGKLRELAPLLAEAGFEARTLADLGVAEDEAAEAAIEAFDTFDGNALAKARHFHAITGRPVLADDSGLCVDALGGRPGVHSKRWGMAPGLAGAALDAANNAKLLAALAGVADRRAHYACAAAWADGTRELVAMGTVPGAITTGARGTGGFGYDPYFASDELGMTFGEAPLAEKQRVSHRARAVRALVAQLRGHG